VSSRPEKPQQDILGAPSLAMRPPLREELRQVLEGALAYEDARGIVQQAGLSGDASLIPLLKDIAEQPSGERNLRLTFDALCAAWLLGEPRDYFLANARAHAAKKWLAYYSILLLGREPGDEQAAALEAVKAETKDNQISGAIAEAVRVRALADQYPESGTLEERTAFVLRYSRGEWSPITLDPPGLGWALKPVTAWAQWELWRLAQEAPETVARQIARLDEPEAYRAYLVSLLG
jgi:hypothetical protein